MVSTLSRQEKFNQVRRNFCFYLDIQEHELCRSISRRLQDMGLQQEQVLSARVTHVVRDAGAGDAPRWRREPGRARADAMLERVRRASTQHTHVLLTVDKAIALLDKLYDTFFTAPKANIRLFTKHYIKIEFLDKTCRPLYKEFDEWPSISVEPNLKRREKKEPSDQGVTVNNNYNNTIGQNREMTRKNRPRTKEKEDASPTGGYLAELASRSPLDSLLANGERRSLRNMCNGGSPPPAVNGGSPRDDDEPRPRRARRALADDPQYYKVVGVSTKLRSSGGFRPPRKDSEPACDGAKPLVVKFRKVRRSELSVLSDEAEQFMFPKRASSTSSTSSSDGGEDERPPPARALERRRQARPTALKEESSEEDSWFDGDRGRRRRAPPAVRRTRRTPGRPPTPEPEPPPAEPPAEAEVAAEPEVASEPEAAAEPAPPASPLREEPPERCMRWEDGRLRYTPAVERLEFAFESVPRGEPWFDTFERQDRDRVTVRNVPRCFALYSTSPRLPYELGRLPPPAPDCCPLSALPTPARARPERSYGTRGLKSRAKLHKRQAALAALDDRPRKSPREHASTLAMLGSAGLLRRRPDDAKSTASEDTVGDAARPEPPPSAAREADERLRAFLAGVFDDAAEYDVDDVDAGALPAARAPPDVLGLVSECDACDIIRDEIADAASARRRRRGRFRKRNRTGWPNKRRPKRGSRTDSSEDGKTESSLDRSSVESPRAAETCDGDDRRGRSDAERDEGAARNEVAAKNEVESEEEARDEAMDVDRPDEDDEPLRLDVKVLLENEKDKKAEAKGSRSSVSESDDRDERIRAKKKRALTNLASWLQPVVRVARVDPAAARRLRSAGAGKTRSQAHRLR